MWYIWLLNQIWLLKHCKYSNQLYITACLTIVGSLYLAFSFFLCHNKFSVLSLCNIFLVATTSLLHLTSQLLKSVLSISMRLKKKVWTLLLFWEKEILASSQRTPLAVGNLEYYPQRKKVAIWKDYTRNLVFFQRKNRKKKRI